MSNRIDTSNGITAVKWPVWPPPQYDQSVSVAVATSLPLSKPDKRTDTVAMVSCKLGQCTPIFDPYHGRYCVVCGKHCSDVIGDSGADYDTIIVEMQSALNAAIESLVPTPDELNRYMKGAVYVCKAIPANLQRSHWRRA